MREVTEKDFRKPEFIDAKVEDYEFRDDGKLVRKDRFQTTVFKIASILRLRDFECQEVIDEVDSLLNELKIIAKLHSLGRLDKLDNQLLPMFEKLVTQFKEYEDDE